MMTRAIAPIGVFVIYSICPHDIASYVTVCISPSCGLPAFHRGAELQKLCNASSLPTGLKTVESPDLLEKTPIYRFPVTSASQRATPKHSS